MTPESNAAEKVKKIKQKKIRLAKMRIDGFFVIFFFVLILIMGILFFIMPKKEESVRENRKLTDFPEVSAKALWDGTFTANLNLYYSDNFAFRDNFVDAKYAVSEAKGLKVDDITIVGSDVTGDVVLRSNSEKFLYDLTSILSIKPMLLDDTLDEISFDAPLYVSDNNEKMNKALEEILTGFLILMNRSLRVNREAVFILSETLLSKFSTAVRVFQSNMQMLLTNTQLNLVRV